MIGIGVNVAIDAADFPADLRWPATSIGGGATVGATRDAVSDALGRWVDAPAAEVLASFAAATPSSAARSPGRAAGSTPARAR